MSSAAVRSRALPWRFASIRSQMVYLFVGRLAFRPFCRCCARLYSLLAPFRSIDWRADTPLRSRASTCSLPASPPLSYPSDKTSLGERSFCSASKRSEFLNTPPTAMPIDRPRSSSGPEFSSPCAPSPRCNFRRALGASFSALILSVLAATRSAGILGPHSRLLSTRPDITAPKPPP